MKKIFLALVLLLLCAAAQAETPAAYLTEDGLFISETPRDNPVTSLTLGSGESISLSADCEITRTYTGGRYCALVKDGVLQAGERGETKIVLYTPGGEVTLKVTVKKAPTAVEIYPSEAELALYSTDTFRWELPSGCAGGVSFSSSDETVAVVDGSGNVTALSPGQTTVTVTTYNGKTDSCLLTVPYPAPAEVILPENICVYRFESASFPVTLSGGWQEDVVSVVTDDESVCRVIGGTTLEGVAVGQTTLTVTASGGGRAVTSVTVLPCAESIAPAQGEITLYCGGTAVLQAETQGGSGEFTASTNQTELLFCEGNTVTALACGKGTVTLTAPGGASASVSVTVLPLPEELSPRLAFEPAAGESVQICLWEGQGVYLPVTFTAEGCCCVTEDGYLTALTPGEAAVTAEIGGVSFPLILDIPAPAEALLFTEKTEILGAGDSAVFRAQCLGGGGQITYTCLDPEIAVLNGETLTALCPGTARVQARVVGGAEETVCVTVYAAAARVIPSFEAAVIGEGDRIPFSWSYAEGEFSLVTVKAGEGVQYQDGYLTGTTAGSIVPVELVSVNGTLDTVYLTVAEAPLEIKPCGEALLHSQSFASYLCLSAGETAAVTASAPGLTLFSYLAESLDPDIAGVTGNIITGIRSGTARVRVTAYNGVSADILVEVK